MIDKTEMEEFVLNSNGKRKMKFIGEKIAEVSNRYHTNETGVFREIDLYRTSGGNLVVQKSMYTQWQGCSNTFEAHLAKSEEELIDFLGLGSLAKELYDAAGIECVELVD